MLKRLKSPAVRASVGTLVAGLMVASLLVVTAGIVAAQTSTSPINACYDNKSGAMRYLVSGQCTSKEKAVSWNTAGPKGDTGDTGPAGLNGVDGTNGIDGTNGADGATGPAGPSGLANLRTVKTEVFLAGDTVSNFTAKCDDASHPGSKAINGGYIPNSGLIVNQWSFPDASSNGLWRVGVATQDNGTPITGSLYALCADAAG